MGRKMNVRHEIYIFLERFAWQANGGFQVLSFFLKKPVLVSFEKSTMITITKEIHIQNHKLAMY